MTFSDTINRMIENILQASTWTSAGGNNPVDNFIKEFRGVENPDLEAEIKDLIEKEQPSGKRKKQKDINDKVENFEAGNVGDLQKLTSQQFGNVKQMATNPVQFIFATTIKKLGKFARFGAFAFFAFLIDQGVRFAINEAMKPGRWLDRRFKRIIKSEILLFNTEREQQELRQGFRSVIITTMKFLRGDQVRGQISGNLYNPSVIPLNRRDPRRVVEPNPRTQGLRGQSRFFNRRVSRFG